MSRFRPSLSERVYRALLRLFPRRFRHKYGNDARELFRDRLAEARTRRGGLARLWLRTLPDLVVHGALERLGELRGGWRLSDVAPPRALRHAVRRLLRTPGTTLIGALCVALGIGSVITILSAVEGLFLRPLPGLERPERLVVLRLEGPSSLPNLRDLRAGAGALHGVAGFITDLAGVRVTDDTERVLATAATADYFSVLGTHPALGRFFDPGEDGPSGAHPVAVVSHDFWRRRMGGEPAAIGSTIRVNGTSLTVVGVAPVGFIGTFVGFPVDVWMPLAMATVVAPDFDASERGVDAFEIVGRLADSATLESARVQLRGAATRLASAYPDVDRGLRVEVRRHTGLDPEIRAPIVALVALLSCLAASVLFIACFNLTNMLVARTAARTKEMAVRRALGVGRLGLFAMVLTDNILIALTGAGGGLLMAHWMSGRFAGFLRALPVRVHLDIRLDWSLTVASLVLALMVAFVTGLIPALRVAGHDLAKSLKGSVGPGSGARGWRHLLLGAQLAASTALLVVAGLFLQTIVRLSEADLGFRADDLVVVPFLDAAPLGIRGPAAPEFFARMVEDVRAVPGVADAAVASALPLAFGGFSATRIDVPGLQGSSNDRDGQEVTVATVSPGFARTLGIALLEGRGLQADDGPDAEPVATVSEAMAERFWPGEDPLGHSFRHGDTDVTIVGVVANVAGGLDRTAGATFYRPQAQRPSESMSLVLRTSPGAGSAAHGVVTALRTFEPDLPTAEPQPLTRLLLLGLLPQRVAGILGGALGGMGLILAALGVYGMSAFSVVQRRREIGVRMAIGATRASILALVFGEIARLSALGILSGVALGLAAGWLARSFLVGVAVAAPLPMLVAGTLVAAFALLATVAPAQRASRVDPMVALHPE